MYSNSLSTVKIKPPIKSRMNIAVKSNGYIIQDSKSRRSIENTNYFMFDSEMASCYYMQDIKAAMNSFQDGSRFENCLRFKESFEDVYRTIKSHKQWVPKKFGGKLVEFYPGFNQNEKVLFLDMDECLMHTSKYPVFENTYKKDSWCRNTRHEMEG